MILIIVFMKLKKGDNAVMLSSKDKGKKDSVLLVIPEEQRAVI